VLGTEAGGVRTVSAVVTGLGWLPRLARTWWGLVGCGDSGSWLSSSLRVGDTVSMSLGFPDGLPRAAVGGGQVLVSGGAAYADPDRPSLDPGNRNPETFACVSADGLGVLFGVLDGRSRASAGVTYAELTKYLLRLKCYSGMVLDGGGSSTMVAKLPGRGSNSVMNVPSDGRPRRVADGLYVYSN
jgi:exopolysaccharide biosynthesis protein